MIETLQELPDSWALRRDSQNLEDGEGEMLASSHMYSYRAESSKSLKTDEDGRLELDSDRLLYWTLVSFRCVLKCNICQFIQYNMFIEYISHSGVYRRGARDGMLCT